MKAAVWKEKGKFVLEEYPIPRPAEDQIVMKVTYCGVCGSDLHRAYTHGEVAPGVVIGHEYCGVVHEVGPNVTRWKPGDRIVSGGGWMTPPEQARDLARKAAQPPGDGKPFRYSPRMLARSGAPGTLDQGGFAEYKLMYAWQPAPIPDNVPDLSAVTTEPCSVALHATRLANIQLGDVVAVLGLGVIGLYMIQFARAAGAGRIIGVDISPLRLDFARQLGADLVINSRESDPVEALVAASGKAGPDVIFECAGAPPTLDQALSAVNYGGKVILVGLSWDPVQITPVEWIGRQVQMICSYGMSADEWRLSLDMMSRGVLHPERVIRPEDIFPLERIHEAFELALQGKNVKPVIAL